MSKNVFVYCQENENIHQMIEELKSFVSSQGWTLWGGAVDLQGNSDRLFEIQDHLDEFHAILIYSEKNLDDFNSQLIRQLSELNGIELIKYKND